LSTRPVQPVPIDPRPSPAAGQLWCQDLISINDLGPSGVSAVLDLAALIKARPEDFRGALAGKQVVMFFEKPSLRTRLTFEAGITSLGGHAFFVDQTASRLDARERLSDIAHNLERWVDGIVLRTFAHATVTGMAEHANIPVVNALSDLEHPCQALADYLTLQEQFGDLRSVKLAYVGDGNNVAHSLLLTAACLGSTIRVATPEGYGPNPEILKQAKKIAANTGATIQVLSDVQRAVSGVDAIYTDVWASMGQEQEAADRKQIFGAYQVNDKLFAKAAPQAIFMHCLPAHRGEEVTDAVIDSPRSVVFDQAENRLHVQKAIMLMLLRGTFSHSSNGSKKPRRTHA
jgi:ornithine carbamoyltransferase